MQIAMIQYARSKYRSLLCGSDSNAIRRGKYKVPGRVLNRRRLVDYVGAAIRYHFQVRKKRIALDVLSFYIFTYTTHATCVHTHTYTHNRRGRYYATTRLRLLSRLKMTSNRCSNAIKRHFLTRISVEFPKSSPNSRHPQTLRRVAKSHIPLNQSRRTISIHLPIYFSLSVFLYNHVTGHTLIRPPTRAADHRSRCQP